MLIQYTVKQGDTLETISNYYKVSPERILSHNHKLSKQPLPVGMRLIIPTVKEGLNNRSQ